MDQHKLLIEGPSFGVERSHTSLGRNGSNPAGMSHVPMREPLIQLHMGTWNSYGLVVCMCATSILPADIQAARYSEGTVLLTGWLQAFDLNMTDVTVEVTVNGAGSLVSVSENGRFTVELPADTEAVLRFEKPGHEPKELRVDTHNASADARARRQHVKFAVILDLKRHMGGWAYSGPVAFISFTREAGSLLVQHTRELVPQERIMEF